VEKTYSSCQKHESLSLHDLPSTDRHLLGLSYIASLKSNLCRAVTAQNAAANNFIISHAYATTAFRPDVFLNGIHRLLVTVKELSAFPSQTNCQGQLQTPLSVLVPQFSHCCFLHQCKCLGITCHHQKSLLFVLS